MHIRRIDHKTKNRSNTALIFQIFGSNKVDVAIKLSQQIAFAKLSDTNKYQNFGKPPREIGKFELDSARSKMNNISRKLKKMKKMKTVVCSDKDIVWRRKHPS